MLTTIALAVLLQQGEIIALEKDPWAGFAVGSWVKLKSTRGPVVEEARITLAAENRFERDPAPEEGSASFPRVFVPYTRVIGILGLKQLGKGTETLKVGAKARVAEFGPADPSIVWAVRWRVSTSDDVPGGVGRVTIEVAGDKPGRVTLEAVAVEKLKVGTKDVPCVRFQYKRTIAREDGVEASYWLSSQVPGLLVRFVARSGKAEARVDALDFEAKK